MVDFQPASLVILFYRRDRNASFEAIWKLTTHIQWKPSIQNDFICLENLHIPLTKEKSLEAAYPLGLPESWSAEDEASLPHEIRRIII